MVARDLQYYINTEKYGYTDSKNNYSKITKKLIELVEENCFSVWLGRLIYNYFLDGNSDEDEVDYKMDMLNPSDNEIDKAFSQDFNFQEFSIAYGRQYRYYDFSYSNHIFVLIPTRNPWETLAWIPVGSFNCSPDELHKIALAKKLYEQFDARIMYISSGSIEFYIPDPLVEKNEVDAAARILIAADQDIYQDYDVSVQIIRGCHNWILWWD